MMDWNTWIYRLKAKNGWKKSEEIFGQKDLKQSHQMDVSKACNEFRSHSGIKKRILNLEHADKAEGRQRLLLLKNMHKEL